MTDSELLTAFYRWAQSRLAPSTVKTYRAGVNAFRRWTPLALDSVTLETLDGYLSVLQLSGLSDAAVRVRCAAVRRLFRFASSRGLLRVDPAAEWTLPRIRRIHEVEVFTASEVESILAFDPSPPNQGKREPRPFFLQRWARDHHKPLRDRAAWAIAFDAALRCHEVAALTWDSLDFSTRRLTLTTGKNLREPWTHALDMRTIELLAAWKEAQGTERGSMFGVSAVGLRDAFDRWCRGAGVKSRRFHALRAARATIAADAGMRPEAVQRLLRHRSYDTTARHYLRAPTQARASRERTAALPWNWRKIAS